MKALELTEEEGRALQDLAARGLADAEYDNEDSPAHVSAAAKVAALA